MELIKIKDLNFSYDESNKKSLDNINLNIKEGEFVLLIGESGCGKSTLLKQLKNELAPFGEFSGEILYDGIPLKSLDQRKSASEIGFVMQNPDYQIVTDKVWHELAFGLESLGLDSETIRRRVSEMASFFGIQTWFRKDVSELSGGQKQLLNLAAIMAMQPRLLILDEPTSQLDPIAAAEFLETIYKINRELGITVVLTEHRIEDVFSAADKVVLMEEGKIVGVESPRKIGKIISDKENKHPMFYSLPTPTRIFEECDGSGSAPITIKEGREWARENFQALSDVLKEVSLDKSKEAKSYTKEDTVIELKDIWFRYDRNAPDILKGVDLKVYKNELLCILGGNGTGKSTTLGVIAGNNKAYRGEVYINNKKVSKYKLKELFNKNLGVLPQDPQSLFVKSTLLEDLKEVFDGMDVKKEERENKIKEVSKTLKIEELLNSHPYDLSGGEQQKAALAKVLLLDPKIIILDEPTKGIDGSFKRELGKIFEELKKSGVTILMVTHDIEFAAENADRCAMFFDGGITSKGTPREFFCGNSFYTTAANKMTRGILNNILKVEDVVKLWKKEKNHLK
ncbi:energy-coupling factor transport system ATP-binding protein [Clostridium collagenovorans DSM 3089]|uniref:Energy-coupling factor transport system ATP-binding protein n=1 Tax=Clostridium collagenovorans DSM 3089 TaxID=1121306 RepID=A0A1M5VEI1_9CLOT|nr:ABC transporter ATP-binding protein [Clostridium collagenovorans]SHH73657.1 energy-coupling factor transport system ATP-binding protein [Clostridium collagenovorans DSM 3089]